MQAEAKAIGARAIASRGGLCAAPAARSGFCREGPEIFRARRPRRRTTRRRRMGRGSRDPWRSRPRVRRTGAPTPWCSRRPPRPSSSACRRLSSWTRSRLPAETRARDVSGSRRCAVSALLDALLAPGSTLVAAGERRPGRAGSPLHLSQGDGGAAALVADEGAARLLGWASLSHDLVDVYASREHPEPYAYEERFVRETAVSEIFAPTIRKALAKAGLARLRHPACRGPRAARGPVARHRPRDRDRGARTTRPTWRAALGDLGAAHGLFALRACSGAGEAGRAHPAGRIRQRLRRAGARNDGADAGRRIGGGRAAPGCGVRRLCSLSEPERRARARLGRALGIRAEGAGHRASSATDAT